MKDTRQYIANLCRFSAQALTRTAEFVPGDKLNWQPMGAARSACDVLMECEQALQSGTEFMRTGVFTMPDREARQAALKNPPPRATLTERMQKAADEFAKAIEKYPVEKLSEMQPSPFGGQPTPLGMILSLPVFNMIYHYGQVNYLQMMLGDTQMH